MRIEQLDPAALPERAGNYTHGTVITDARKILYVSGQPPWGGELPADFDAQCRLAWRNVLMVLAEAGMGVENLAKVTVFLSGRRYREANARIRGEVLGQHRPAMTVIICDIYAEEWLLEIEATAIA